jgi:hypothetical protein
MSGDFHIDVSSAISDAPFKHAPFSIRFSLNSFFRRCGAGHCGREEEGRRSAAVIVISIAI